MSKVAYIYNIYIYDIYDIYIYMCVRLDCPCASFHLVHPFVESSACRRLRLASVWLRAALLGSGMHLESFEILFAIGWHSCAFASAPDFDLVHSWRFARVCFECLAPFSWLGF